MRLLPDYHHSDLFESWALLCDRFGWELFRPIGMEWFDLDYWQFEKTHHGDAVAKQYLALWDTDELQFTTDGSWWERKDSTHPGRVHKMLTVEQARDAGIDVVIASVPDNESGLHRFASEVNAAFGVQLGNNGQVMQVNWQAAQFALLSTTTGFIKIPVPHVVYRQEFSLSDFRYDYPPLETNSVASFVQCFPENRGPERGNFYDEFLHLAETHRDEFDFKVYGAYGSAPEDHLACGNLSTTPEVAEHMRDARIIWHAKFWSDGYGHVIHNAHAVGRPVMAYHNYYADKLAAPLMIHGETGFDLSQMNEAEIVSTLRRLRDDSEYHEQICTQTANRFRQIVNFDEDAANVRAIIEAVA